MFQFFFQPGSSLPIPPTLNPQPAREAENPEPEINQETLQILLDMGFPRERCLEAVEATSSLDQATDYLLRPQAVLSNYGMGLVSGMGEQEDLARALAMSLGDNVMVSTDPSSEASESRQKEDEENVLLKEEFEPLNKQVIDDFTNDALQGCLCLLDSLPNTVYRVCDLLISIFNRNGPDFKQATLNELMQEVMTF
jgi:E3 ubiquitin-protein ligase HUWE1